MNLSNKNILIIGGSSGIGLALAELLSPSNKICNKNINSFDPGPIIILELAYL